MIVHVLGGGPGQVALIKRIGELGYETVVSDMNPRAPGLAIASYPSRASSFSPEEVIRDAQKYGSDFFVTAGTDQPVLTAALASEELGKPYFLTPAQAMTVTNKKVMKEALTRAGIGNRNYAILGRDFSDEEISGLTFPLVLKPLDSQGQRGVMKVSSPGEIRELFDYVLSFSRQREILAEEYYSGAKEITVSGWCHAGEAHILSITDRVTVDNGSHLGVCVAHRYPSACHGDWSQIESVVKEITQVIGLSEGPLYIQILHGDEGYSVNEIACRLGGAYEDEFLPWLCGVPLLDYMIEMTVGRDYNDRMLSTMEGERKSKYLSLEMFFYRPGIIGSQSGMAGLKQRKGILGGDFLLKEGTEIVSRNNSTQRAGYFIATSSKSLSSLSELVEGAYGDLRAADDKGRSLLCRF